MVGALVEIVSSVYYLLLSCVIIFLPLILKRSNLSTIHGWVVVVIGGDTVLSVGVVFVA